MPTATSYSSNFENQQQKSTATELRPKLSLLTVEKSLMQFDSLTSRPGRNSSKEFLRGKRQLEQKTLNENLSKQNRKMLFRKKVCVVDRKKVKLLKDFAVSSVYR